MKTLFMSGLLLSTTFSAIAADDMTAKNAGIAAQEINKSRGTVMALSERGPKAVDAAHLLAIQSILHPTYKPQLMALETTELAAAEAKYNVVSTDLPVFIFVDKQGAEIGRIVAGPLTTVGRYVANNSAILE